MRNKPNIILNTTNQQRFDTVNALGASQMWTPHFNWLVDNGISFTRTYSDCPVCMPARNTIMSGLAAYEHGDISNRYID
jgi:arylsulfatase